MVPKTTMTRKNNRPDPVSHTPGGEVPSPRGGEIVLYQALDSSISLDVRLQRETIWLNQKKMALLFEKDSDTIGLHIRNACREGELEEQSTTEDFSVVQTEGGRDVRRRVRFYNLDVSNCRNPMIMFLDPKNQNADIEIEDYATLAQGYGFPMGLVGYIYQIYNEK